MSEEEVFKLLIELYLLFREGFLESISGVLFYVVVVVFGIVVFCCLVVFF